MRSSGRRAGGARGQHPRVRALLLHRDPRVVFDVPQQGFPASPASSEVVFPLDGPRGTPPTGPGVDFNTAARWRLWDPNAVARSFDALWPALSSPSDGWDRPNPQARWRLDNEIMAACVRP